MNLSVLTATTAPKKMNARRLAGSSRNSQL